MPATALPPTPTRSDGVRRVLRFWREPSLLREEEALYEEWRRYGPHLLEYGAEAAVTAVLVFFVVTLAGLNFASGAWFAEHIGSTRLRLLLTGLELGGVGWLLALTPAGKRSGAHLNPAVSLGFVLLGKMKVRDFAGYAAAQMAGGLIGAVLAAAGWTDFGPATHFGALQPAAGVGAGGAFLAEVLATFCLTLVVYTFLTHQRLMRLTPVAVALAIGLLVMVAGTISGAGMNPARWFGPAAASGLWSLFWVYLAGPMIGSTLAVAAHRHGLRLPLPATGKVFHDARYPSIFFHDRVPSTPPRRLTDAMR